MIAHFSLEILQPDNNEMAHLKCWKENIIDLESYIQKKKYALKLEAKYIVKKNLRKFMNSRPAHQAQGKYQTEM